MITFSFKMPFVKLALTKDKILEQQKASLYAMKYHFKSGQCQTCYAKNVKIDYEMECFDCAVTTFETQRNNHVFYAGWNPGPFRYSTPSK